MDGAVVLFVFAVGASPALLVTVLLTCSRWPKQEETETRRAMSFLQVTSVGKIPCRPVCTESVDADRWMPFAR